MRVTLDLDLAASSGRGPTRQGGRRAQRSAGDHAPVHAQVPEREVLGRHLQQPHAVPGVVAPVGHPDPAARARLAAALRRRRPRVASRTILPSRTSPDPAPEASRWPDPRSPAWLRCREPVAGPSTGRAEGRDPRPTRWLRHPPAGRTMPSPQPQTEITAASNAVRNHPDRRVAEPVAGGSGTVRRWRAGPRAPFRRQLALPAGPDAGSAGGGEGGPEPAAGPDASPPRQRAAQASMSPRSYPPLPFPRLSKASSRSLPGSLSPPQTPRPPTTGVRPSPAASAEQRRAARPGQPGAAAAELAAGPLTVADGLLVNCRRFLPLRADRTGDPAFAARRQRDRHVPVRVRPHRHLEQVAPAVHARAARDPPRRSP